MVVLNSPAVLIDFASSSSYLVMVANLETPKPLLFIAPPLADRLDRARSTRQSQLLLKIVVLLCRGRNQYRPSECLQY